MKLLRKDGRLEQVVAMVFGYLASCLMSAKVVQLQFSQIELEWGRAGMGFGGHPYR